MIQNEKGCYGRMYLGECRGTKVAIKKLFQQNPSPSTLASFKHEIEVARFIILLYLLLLFLLFKVLLHV